MKMKFLVCLCLLAACSGPRSAPGTVPDTGGIVIDERLSNQRVNAFAEDGDGHIWIGTFRGLDKYTVHDYHQYFATGDSLGLPDNQVTALYCSNAGKLWVSTMNGVAYRTEDGRFHRVPCAGNGNFSTILETRDGQILFSDLNSLQRYDAGSDRIRPVIRDYGSLFSIVGPDGTHITPSAPVEVVIKLQDASSSGEDFSVLHFEDDEALPAQMDAETSGNIVSFTTDSFSAYAIVQGPGIVPMGWFKVSSISELRERSSEGLYIGHKDGYYMTDRITTTTAET